MRYRADIDGLRAVAVVPVVLFHAGSSVFKGGFVGVDVFFVISGYLITSIIKAEINSKSFSIAVFYDRRIRRIFPALIVVILFCLVAGFALLTPSDYSNLCKSVLATAFFVSNLFFWQQANYFDTPAAEKPLLHTWSLSIEEQFYLCFPVILIFLSKISRRIRVLAVAIACLASFAACAALVYVKPSATFYLGPTRAWELLFGGLIALEGFAVAERVRASDHRLFNDLAATSGLLLLLVPIFLYSPSMTFPGISALLPVTGTGLLIWTGLVRQTYIHRLLSVPLVVAVGKASYSLYLWHFPLLAFAAYATQQGLGELEAGAVCLVSLAVSFASLQFIEQPFRHPYRKPASRRLVALAVSGMAGVAMLGAAVVLSDGVPSRLSSATVELLSVEQEKVGYYHWECLSLEQTIVRPAQACKLGSPNVEPTVLLWGDSHAVVTEKALEQSALQHGAAFLFAASVDCPIGIGFSIDRAKGPSFVSTPGYQFCAQYNNEMLKLAIERPNIRSVVLSSRWTNWRVGEPGSSAEVPVDLRLRDEHGVAGSPTENKDIFARGFERLVRSLIKAGKVVWIVGPLPEASVRVPKALYVKQLGLDHTDIDVTRSAFLRKNQFILSLFENMAKRYPLNFVWPHSVLCDEQICSVVDNGKPLFFDSNHLSAYGVAKTSALYDAIFKAPTENRRAAIVCDGSPPAASLCRATR